MIRVAKAIPFVLIAASGWRRSTLRPIRLVRRASHADGDAADQDARRASSWLVPAITLFLLYLFRPRPYVFAGAVAGLAASVMMLVLSFESGAPAPSAGPDRIAVGRLAVGVWAIAALLFGAAVRLAAGWFRAPAAIPRMIALGFPIAAAWTVIAAAFLGPAADRGAGVREHGRVADTRRVHLLLCRAQPNASSARCSPAWA